MFSCRSKLHETKSGNGNVASSLRGCDRGWTGGSGLNGEQRASVKSPTDWGITKVTRHLLDLSGFLLWWVRRSLYCTSAGAGGGGGVKRERRRS